MGELVAMTSRLGRRIDSELLITISDSKTNKQKSFVAII